MAMAQTHESTPRKPLRLWPAVAALTLWLAWLVVPFVAPSQAGTAVLSGLVFGLVVILWWLFFSRAPWAERLGALVLMVAGVAAISRLVHPSIANGMMGFMLPVYSFPILCLALVVWAVVSRGMATGHRRVALVGAILLACATTTLVRTNGLTGNADSDLEWRWTPTPEERLLAQGGDEPMLPAPAAADAPEKPVPPPAANEPAASGSKPVAPPSVAATAETEAVWPGFRGPDRDGVVGGVRIETNWAQTPPVQMWRRPVGPGWSSFAVRGDRFFTQEQRGENEIVSAYNLKTGEPVWRHRDKARFWESNAGAGPRATPTVSNGRVYTLGGTGILNALNARTGAVVWSRNAASDTGKTVPDWGIASSPLVVGDVVVVATAGWLAAYDAATGKWRWFGPKTGFGYSSPHLATIDGVAQVVLANGPGAIGVSPSDGVVLWKYEWPGDSIVQPAVLPDGNLLLGSGSGMSGHSGMTRLGVTHEPGGWTVKERWTSSGLKPYFNDFVVHKGHAFGFDGSLLACIDLADGTRKWKGGRYGHGQLVVLRDQDLLLVLSEEGELALVKATSDQFTEVARIRAIEGKTWNHPVVAGDVLLVRNDQEMAAFRLSLTGADATR
jgi:outer membrane protein assembly factor BamB